MLSLLTLYIESSKVSGEIFTFNPVRDQEVLQDAVSYLFCSFTEGANETGTVEAVKKQFFNKTHFNTQKQVDEKKQSWQSFLESNTLNGIVDIYPVDDKLHLFVYGNLSVLQFRNNELEVRITGSFGKIQSVGMKIEADDVVMIVLNSCSSADYTELYVSERFPMLFVDAVGEAETLLTESPQFTARVRSIMAKQGRQDRSKDWEVIVHPVHGDSEETKTLNSPTVNITVTNNEPENITGEKPSFFDKVNHFFKASLFSIKAGSMLWGILCFVTGFILVLVIMYLIMPDNESLKRLFLFLK